MKRSEINTIIRRAEEDFGRVGFRLPEFANWDADAWRERGTDVAEMVRVGLGWDVTDFGSGSFSRKGLLLFTVRNGTVAGSQPNRPYAEKIMISRRDQITPMHRHITKIEDIIVRGALADGAKLAVQLYAMAEDGSVDEMSNVVAHLDGMEKTLAAGTVLTVEEGRSITLFPGSWHAFWGEGGDVVVGEVSTVNDDRTDNVFVEPVARFADIDEDEPVYRAIVNDTSELAG